MSTLALPLGAGRIKTQRRSRLAAHPLLAPKRLLQLALIALVVVPIPSDDGPFKPHVIKPHVTAAAQAKITQLKPAPMLAVRVSR